MERGEKHLDTEHAADCLSELISSSRLDQLDLDSSLSFLNDPASLLESTLATDASLIPPLLEGGEVIDPSSFLNMNIGPDQGSHAREDAAAALNPPLSVSDLSSFMSAFESLPLLSMTSPSSVAGTPNSIGGYVAKASQSTAASHRPPQNATSNALRQNFVGGRPPTVSAAQSFLSSLSSQTGGMLTVSNALSMSLSSNLSRLPQQMSLPTTVQAQPAGSGQPGASIPLLQFLQQNFPKIHDDLKGLIQSTASPMLGRPPQNNISPSAVPNLPPVFTPPKPAMPSSRSVPLMAATSSRTPVFAQIISSSPTSQPALTVASKTLVATPRPLAADSTPAISTHHHPTPPSPQLQSRHPGTRPAPLSHQVTVSAASPLGPRASPEGAGVSNTGRQQPLSASQLSTAVGMHVKMEAPVDLNRRKTLVQSADNNVGDHGDGGGDIDVGLPVQRCEFPPHLREHNYCLYNLEEGLAREKRQVALDAQFLCNIPPARLSYAPVIPESPATLYKLLKVQPSKSSTPRPRLLQGRLGARQRGSGRRGGGGRGGGGRSKSGSQAGSDESHGSSSDPEFADDGRAMNLSQRRRSQRNAGQRKHYVDDVELNISDDDDGVMDELEVVAKKRQYKGYRDDESEEDADGSRSKHKRTITVNPTEGFSYSDIFLDPPPEEANIVEKILLVRTRTAKTEEELQKYGDQVEEFLVKYKNYSYLHAEWATVDKLLVGDKRFEGKARRFKSKKEAMGVFASMDDEPFNPEYTMVDRVLDVATQVEPGGEVVTHYLVKWSSLPYEDSTWELEEDVNTEKVRIFNKQCAPLRGEEKEFKPRPPPALFRPIKDVVEYKGGNYLRPYQQEGLNWLLFNWYTRQNCILADEMGLGKTVQSIAFLMEVMAAGIRGPFLVIAPLSTIANWQREFESWSDLNVIIYHGSAYSRRMIHEYELYHRDSQGKIITNSYKFNAIVTTYEVILSDDSGLHGIEWRVVVIDEAHRLKNRNCKLLEGLKTLYMEHRVLLTGTPLQNSVDELFSLLNFLEPSTFPSHVAFLQKFGDLKTEEQVEELKAILKPMMLRRLKQDVEKSLAAKEETIIEVELTATQKQYYRAILERNFNFLSKGSGTTVPSLLNVMMELRKCCNHPFLIAGAEAKILQDFKVRHAADKPLWHALIQASGKLVLIDKLLPKLKQSGHKVLIFSQMVRCLDILEDYLRVQGYLYERIDGQVRGILRQAAIDRFSKPGSDRFVFLLCTRAGGLGINLTAADTVIIYDSDWNPQNDVQAQARCHRIGQSKAVKVYRLITRNSYEREMFDRASLKLGLDRAVLQSMNSQRDPIAAANGPPQFSKKDVENLLKKGAYGLVMEEDDDANKFCEEDIDQILERRTRVIQLESEGKGSTFSKASFVADGSSDISIDDPDFWQKWAEKAKLDLNELANKDNLVLDTPRQRRQVRRYGNEHMGELVDLGDDMMDMFPLRTSRRGWSKVECLKVEKGLLTYGWGQWRDILRAAKFKKRQLGLYDAESISRMILVYCLSHFTGDDKVRPYIHRLVDPSEDPEGLLLDREFTEEDFLAMLSKDPEALFPDDTYMKHLRRHANKILLRIRQLHIIRWSMLAPYVDKAMKGVPAKSLGLNVPQPEEPPPATWWNNECDVSLLVGIIKHGYEQFGLMRSDPALCFKALVGEEGPQTTSKRKGRSVASNQVAGEDDEEEDWSGGGEESEEEAAPPASHERVRRTRGTYTPREGAMWVWPPLADVNTRARRLVNAFLKHQKKEEQRQIQLQKEHNRRQKEAEVSRKKEQKKAELAQKWSKREEQDFARVVSFFGVIFNKQTNKYDWSKFRQLANLTKKSDERLTLYYNDFKEMCNRVLKRKSIRRGLSGVRVEAVNEEKAARCLQRIDLLSAVREEILPHPEFNELIKLCEASFEVPHWWVPVMHDKALLLGVDKHGLYRSDQLIYNDPELIFKETVPQTALFVPNSTPEPCDGEDGSGNEGRGNSPKTQSQSSETNTAASTTPIPLGWPKEKATVIRLTRIVYAFRNRVWPKPMDGLDLFVPVVVATSSSSESESEGMDDSEGLNDEERNSESDYQGDTRNDVMIPSKPWKVPGGLVLTINSRKVAEVDCTSPEVEVVEDRDFEIEKQQGLKITIKKSGPPCLTGKDKEDESNMKLEIRIPLVKLSFASRAGMKRIPKKRPIDRGDSESSPDPKRVKCETLDPTTLKLSDLTGHEKVGVVNRNTQERLPLRQSPALKNLQLWLQGHPHYNVDSNWGPLVTEWGALRPDMYHRILTPGQPDYEPVSD